MCVWYLKVWPSSAWVPARQQAEGSLALRDYLVLLSYFLFYWSGVAVNKAGIHFLRVMLSFLRLLHLRWVICHIVALACLLVNLLGIGLHHLKDKNSWLVDHCFTSLYSSFCDVDRILHTLIMSISIFESKNVYDYSILIIILIWHFKQKYDVFEHFLYIDKKFRDFMLYITILICKHQNILTQIVLIATVHINMLAYTHTCLYSIYTDV